MNREQIIKMVHCPACNASVGKPCWDNRGHKGGKPRKRVHPVRARLATGGKSKRKPPKNYNRDMVKSAPVGKDFYQSWEWQAARFVALKRHGRKCQCCGWSPSDGGSFLVVDHIKPIRTHPHLALDPENHQVLCNNCNMGKSWHHTDDFR